MNTKTPPQEMRSDQNEAKTGQKNYSRHDDRSAQEVEEKEECICNYTTKPDGTDKSGVMCMKHINALISLAKEEERKRIYDDWEVAIRFSENDEDEIPIEKRTLSELVMTNHFKASKEKE